MNPTLTPKVGDRVRITRVNGDEATITVTAADNRHIENDTNWFSLDVEDGGWAVAEILPRPLPTIPGVYAPRGTEAKGVKLLVLTEHEGWYWLDVTAFDEVMTAVAEPTVRTFVDTIEQVWAR